MNINESIDKALETFRFKYAGGGHFRDATIPKGEHADIVHGGEAIKAFAEHLKEQIATVPPDKSDDCRTETVNPK